MTTPPPVTRAHREAADYPDPTEADLADPLFEVIWLAIKRWDLSRDPNRLGYSTATGNDVMHVLEPLRRLLEHRGRTEAEEGGKGWVACEERMPEADENVMIFDDCHEFGIAYRREDGTWKEDLSGLEFRAEQITHWRPLPPPPPGDR